MAQLSIYARHVRRARQVVTVAALVGVLTVGLSGCSSSGGGQLTIMKEPTPPATAPDVLSVDPAAGTDSTSQTTAPKPAPKPGASPVTCTHKNIKTTVTSVVDPPKHLLITATNIGDRPCYAYSAPTISFDLSKDLTIEVLDDSTPQAVVELEPGDSAYAALITSKRIKRQSANSYIATRMALWFSARSGDEQAGSAKMFSLSGDGVYIDESVAQVTYWQQDMDSALLW
jgi:hypothetical protein